MRLLDFCSNDEYAYIAVATSSKQKKPEVKATVGATLVPWIMCDVSLPAAQHALLDGASGHAWVVAFPKLDATMKLTVSADGVTLQRNLTPSILTDATRRLRRDNPRRLDALQGAEYRASNGRTRLELTVVVRDHDDLVCRFRATYPTSSALLEPMLRLADTSMQPIAADPIVMEDALTKSSSDPLGSRVVTFSTRIPADTQGIVATTALIAAATDTRALANGDVDADAGTNPSTGADAGPNAHASQDAIPNADATANTLYLGFLSATSTLRRVREESEARMTNAGDDGGWGYWFDRHRCTAYQAEREWEVCIELEGKLPLVSIVLPVSNDEAAARAVIESLCHQTYVNFELLCVGSERACEVAASLVHNSVEARTIVCEDSVTMGFKAALAQARGTYLLAMGPCDILEPDALYQLVLQAQREEAGLVYCDGDEYRDGHLRHPHLRSFPNLGKLRSFYYLGSPLIVSRESLGKAEPLPTDATYAALLYYLALRAMELGTQIGHVSRVLSHHMATPEDATTQAQEHEAQRTILRGHLARMGAAAEVEDGPEPCTYRVRYAVSEPAPLVSVIIPTRDHAELLEPCVQSILEKTTYPTYEVVLVENNSEDPETFRLYERLRQDARVKVAVWEPEQPGMFNYSAIVNFGAAKARGEYLLFLNNDTKVVEGNWMQEMVATAQRSDVAVVGAKLLFEDGLVQHAGMAANGSHENMHVNRDLPADAPGYEHSLDLPGDFNMVTGACQLVKRSVFQELGGYDEQLAVGYNDSDFCLRCREAGYAVTYTPYAVLIHREFSSRGRETYDEGKLRRLLLEKCRVVQGHPDFYAKPDAVINEQLDRWNEWFRLPW